MTPTRAFWEAFATVCIPSLVIWGLALCFVSPITRADEWPLWLMFFLLPLPLIYPVYKRYLKGTARAPALRTRRYHLMAAMSYAALSIAYAVQIFIYRVRKPNEFFPIAMGICWCGLTARQVWLAVKAGRIANQQTVHSDPTKLRRVH